MRFPRYISSHLTRIRNIHRLRPVPSNLSRPFSTQAQPTPPPPTPSPPTQTSEKVAEIVEEISSLSLLEVSDLTEVLRKKLDVKEMPMMAMMMPGMGFAGMPRGGGAAAAAKGGEEKVEKTVFDVKLEGFDAAAKIKVIKEVRSFSDLGLKEAKELVEKAPIVMKKGVTKEEAEKIIAKMKEVGAKASME